MQHPPDQTHHLVNSVLSRTGERQPDETETAFAQRTMCTFRATAPNFGVSASREAPPATMQQPQSVVTSQEGDLGDQVAAVLKQRKGVA